MHANKSPKDMLLTYFCRQHEQFLSGMFFLLVFMFFLYRITYNIQLLQKNTHDPHYTGAENPRYAGYRVTTSFVAINSPCDSEQLFGVSSVCL